MRILTDELCARLRGRAINIHHSFLPGFSGAKPYPKLTTAAEVLIAAGRDSERRALSAAGRYAIEQRVFLNGRRTVVLLTGQAHRQATRGRHR